MYESKRQEEQSPYKDKKEADTAREQRASWEQQEWRLENWPFQDSAGPSRPPRGSAVFTLTVMRSCDGYWSWIWIA